MENKLDKSWEDSVPESNKFLDMLVKSCYLEGATIMQKRVIEEIDEIVNFGKYDFMSSESKLLREIINIVVNIKAD